jgi:hypothetical protein
MQSDLQALSAHSPFEGQLECPVCFGLHNDDIHDASISIRNWFRADVLRRMERPVDMELPSV